MAHSNIRTALLAATEAAVEGDPALAEVIAYAERQLSAAMANEQKTKSREFSVRLGWGELRTLLNAARRSLAAEDGRGAQVR